jgi:hypothetical protein
MLDGRFPAWRLCSVSSRVRDTLRERSPKALPTVVAGDFDGNGLTDYAVLLEYPTFSKGGGAASSDVSEVVALLDQGAAFKLFIVKEPVPPDPRRYLTLQRKGQRGYDLERDRPFTYPNDSIGVWFFGVAGGTYIFSNGGFRYVVESD